MSELLLWWLTLQLFGLAGLPLARWLFRALPDRGYAFGKSLGLLLSGYLAWLLAMLGLAPFGRGLLLACALAVGVGGWWLTRAAMGGDRRSKIEDRGSKIGCDLSPIFHPLSSCCRSVYRTALP